MSEILEALYKLVLPVAVLSFVMVSWALKNGHLIGNSKIRALKKEMKALSKDKNGNQPKQNLFHRQWTKFGGGFYGIVALYTFGLVEWQELRDFIANFGGFIAFIKQFGIDTIIQILIEGIMNFVAAIAWPVYWMSELGSRLIWVWGGMAYGGYWLGARHAQNTVAKTTANTGNSPVKAKNSTDKNDPDSGD